MFDIDTALEQCRQIALEVDCYQDIFRKDTIDWYLWQMMLVLVGSYVKDISIYLPNVKHIKEDIWLDNDSLQSILYEYFDFNISEDSDIADYEMLAYENCTYTAIFFQYATSDDTDIIEESFSLDAVPFLFDSYVYTFTGAYKDIPGVLAVLCILSPADYIGAGIVTNTYDYMCIPTAIYLMGLNDSRRKTHEQ